jgi:hypothetical protein
MELISSIALDRAARSAHCGMSVYVLNAVLCKQASSHSYRRVAACPVVGAWREILRRPQGQLAKRLC